jgi:hypothetical protein
MPEIGPPWTLSPKDWHALRDYDTWNDPFTPDDGVALHHGGGADYEAHNPPYSQAKEIQQLQQWEGFHIYSRGWRGIAYGWAVGQTGTTYRLRGWNKYGAHTGDMDGDGIANNDEIIPILFIGSGSRVALSPAAQAAVERLRYWLESQAGWKLRLYGHRELKGTVTSCPGVYGMQYVTANRELPEEDMALTQEDKDWILAAIASDNVAQTEQVWQRFPIRNSASELVPLVSAIQFIYRAIEQGVVANVDVTAVANAVLTQINLRQAQ